MYSQHFTSYKIEDRSYLSLVKRDINRTLKENGFSDQKAGEVDIIVSEMTSNLVKHTDGGGSLLYRVSPEGDKRYFEIFCMDQGPGTSDIARMMQDGISSSNTLGQGLGAIRRLSDTFHIYSRPEWGTIVYARKNLHDQPARFKPRPLQIKVVQEPIAGEKVCGDGYCIKEQQDSTHILFADGLGHGIHAFEAVRAAIEAFRACEECEPTQVLRFIHEKVRKTRGLVGTVVILDHIKKQWKLAGVGNIATRIYNGLEYRNFMPYNGILGLNVPTKLTDYSMAAENYQILVVTSDGIKNKWDLADNPSLLKHSPAIIAASVFKEHARRTDDMTVLVGKLNFLGNG